MNISPRLGRIFRILLDQEPGQAMSVDDMAARIRVSRRTLFRELEAARMVLDACGMQLVSRPGLALEGDPSALLVLLDKGETGALDREERQDLLLYELLRGEGGQKLVVYAGRFRVSEATISHDLDDLRRRLKPFGLCLSKNGIITGSEESRRQVMSELVREGVEYKTVDYLDPDTVLEQIFSGSAILSLLDQDLLRRLLALLGRSREQLGLSRYEQNSYIGLVIHLVIALERIRSGEAAPEKLDGLPDMEDSRQEARRMARLLEEEFGVAFPDSEIDAIALHLRGVKMNTAGNALSREQTEVLELARAFIEGFPPADAALLGTDSQFIQGLVCHLEPTLIRLKSRLPIYNPLLKTLRQQYPDLFRKTRQAAAGIEQALGLPLSDEEIGFLTMHVGACFERCGHRYRRKVHAAVVCASGIGVSALLCARLEKSFASQLELENLSLSQARQRPDVELFITTFRTDRLPAPMLQVSPLLPVSDMKALQEQLALIQARPAPEPAAARELEHELDRLEEGIQAVRCLAAGIPIQHVQPAGPRALIHEAAQALEGDREQLEADLWRREQLGSVIAEDEKFGLFHARSAGTDRIQAVLLIPEGGPFDGGLQVILVTILPEVHTKAMQDMLSDLNRALAQDEAFRQTLIRGSDDQRCEAIRGRLAGYIRKLAGSTGFSLGAPA